MKKKDGENRFSNMSEQYSHWLLMMHYAVEYARAEIGMRVARVAGRELDAYELEKEKHLTHALAMLDDMSISIDMCRLNRLATADRIISECVYRYGQILSQEVAEMQKKATMGDICLDQQS